LRLDAINIPFQRSPCQEDKIQINPKISPRKAFSICV
jgi:hypothetical protein